MKVATIILGALTALTAAAPLESRDNKYDASKFNNNKFKQQNLQYLNNVNVLDLLLLEQLSNGNNLNVLAFSGLFNSDSFNLQNVIQLAQLQTLLQVGGSGALNGFDLSNLVLPVLELGLLGNVGSVDLTQFIEAASIAQIAQVAGQ